MSDEGVRIGRPLRVVVLTPEATVLDTFVRSLRLPADTGQVGIRLRCEPAVSPLEPGLVLLGRNGEHGYLATAGGVVRSDGRTAVILTPLAVAGDEADSVLSRLADALSAQTPELELRRTIHNLEKGMLLELRRPAAPSRPIRPGAT